MEDLGSDAVLSRAWIVLDGGLGLSIRFLSHSVNIHRYLKKSRFNGLFALFGTASTCHPTYTMGIYESREKLIRISSTPIQFGSFGQIYVRGTLQQSSML